MSTNVYFGYFNRLRTGKIQIFYVFIIKICLNYRSFTTKMFFSQKKIILGPVYICNMHKNLTKIAKHVYFG